MRPLFVVGAGGHGKVVAEAAVLSRQFELLGFFDDDPARCYFRVLGVPVIGALPAAGALPEDGLLALGIGDNRARLLVLDRILQLGATLATVSHPSAVLAPSATLGAGTFVGPLATVHTEARLGRACIVNSAAVIEHDNVLGDGVHVSPNAALGGEVTLETGVHVGIGASVLPGLRVGAWSVVGAGAVVTVDVPPGVVVVGAPARPLVRHAS